MTAEELGGVGAALQTIRSRIATDTREPAGMRSFLVIGGDGAGKTALLDALAADHSGVTMRLRFRRGMTMAPIAGLLLGVEMVARELSDVNASAALREIVQRCDPDADPSTMVDPTVVADFMSAVIDMLADVPGTVYVLMDDVEHMDALSRNFYGQAIEIAGHLDAVVVVTTSTADTTDAFPSPERVALTPLTSVGVAAMCEELTGVRPPHRVAARIHRLTGGTPVLVRELVDALSAAQLRGGSLIPPDQPLGTTAMAHVAKLVEAASEEDVRALRAFTMIDSPSAPIASRIAASFDSSLDRLVQDGWVARRSGQVTFVSGLVERWLLTSPDPAMRAALSQQLLSECDTLLSPAEQLWFESEVAAPEPKLASALAAEATAAVRDSQGDLARRLVAQAWHHVRHDQRDDTAALEARVAAEDGHLHDAADIASAALRTAPPGPTRLEVASVYQLARYATLEASSHETAVQEFYRHADDHPRAAASLLLAAAEYADSLGLPDEAQTAIQTVTSVESSLPPQLRAELTLARARIVEGRPTTELVPLFDHWRAALSATAGRLPHRFIRCAAIFDPAYALVMARTGTAEPLSRLDTMLALMVIAEIENRRGHPDRVVEALDSLETIVSSDVYHRSRQLAIRLSAASIHAHRAPCPASDAEPVPGVEEMVGPQTPASPVLLARVHLAYGLWMLARSDARRATGPLRSAWDAVRDRRDIVRHDVALGVLLPAALTSALVSQDDVTVRQVPDDLGHDTAEQALAAEIVSTLLSPDATGDTTDVDRRLQESPLLTEGDHARLRLVLDAALPSGCPVSVPVVTAPGVHAEPSVASTTAPVGEELAARERKIATLAASGKRNREISEELFVSQRTVEATLTRVFRKLGVRSRTELATVLHRDGTRSPSSRNGNLVSGRS